MEPGPAQLTGTTERAGPPEGGTGSEYDPFAPEVVADPYPWYRGLLAGPPAHFVDGRDVWVLSRYEHVLAGARSHEVLSSAGGVTYQPVPLPMMLTTDPPDHTRLRRIVSRDFTPRAVEAWQPTVEALVARRLGEAIEGGEADFVATVAGPLPIVVIAALLGVPGEDQARFKRCSDAIVTAYGLVQGSSPEQAQAALAAIQELRAYLEALCRERRAHPGGDLLSRLVQHEGGERLTAEELFWFCLLLLVAGHETTTNLLGSLVLALMEHPDQWRLLRGRPELVPAAVEEILRYDPPVQGHFRTALDAYPVDGTEIPRGGRVLLLFAAANRDPRRFDDPDRFLVGRNPVGHVGFGNGIHHCLGAGLARMEARLVLGGVLEMVAAVEPAGPVTRGTNPMLRGPSRLPVRLVPA